MSGETFHAGCLLCIFNKMEFKMKLDFEVIEEKYRKDVIDIFNYYIENSTAAFREKAVDYSFLSHLLDDCIETFKYVIILDSEVVGFCMLEYFIPIKGFSGTAEISYFIKEAFTGRGIGTLVLDRLERDAISCGVENLIANIISDNAQSIKFHEKHGFTKYGELEKAGKKFGRYINIVYMQKILN